MDNNQKTWLSGCGSGCGCGCATFVVVYGLGVLASYLVWEVGGFREDFFEPPAALIWPGALGIIAGGLLGLITIFVVRAIHKKRIAKREAEQPPPQVPPQAPPPPQQYPPQQYPPQQFPPR